MAKTLLVLNEQPYGGERSYNGLRMAIALLKTQAKEVRVFLMGDAASCAKQGQKVPQGYYDIADMLDMVARRQDRCVRVLHGRSRHRRGRAGRRHAPGTMAKLAEWHQWADKALVF